jgi:hypothetical protein
VNGGSRPCELAQSAIRARRFAGWAGLPRGCTPEELFGVPFDDTWGDGLVGDELVPARTRLLDMEGYYRPSAFVRDGVVVLFSGMNPQLAQPWDELRADLGEPDAVLDWVHATEPIPGGERVHARRGITVFVAADSDRVVHVAVYHPTKAVEYVRSLRLGHAKRPLRKI